MFTDIPRSFQDIVSFLLRRHILQLYTNCQAVYDVVEEGSKNDGGTFLCLYFHVPIHFHFPEDMLFSD